MSPKASASLKKRTSRRRSIRNAAPRDPGPRTYRRSSPAPALRSRGRRTHGLGGRLGILPRRDEAFVVVPLPAVRVLEGVLPAAQGPDSLVGGDLHVPEAARAVEEHAKERLEGGVAAGGMEGADQGEPHLHSVLGIDVLRERRPCLRVGLRGEAPRGLELDDPGLVIETGEEDVSEVGLLEETETGHGPGAVQRVRALSCHVLQVANGLLVRLVEGVTPLLLTVKNLPELDHRLLDALGIAALRILEDVVHVRGASGEREGAEEE